MEQYQLDFEGFLSSEDPATWTPRDIWTRLNQRVLEYFKEDRRVERKGVKKADLDDLATYYSTFSNTPDGGLLIYGVDNTGKVVGCKDFTTAQINSIENSHTQRCPLAKPEFKRISVVIDGKPTFCYAIFVPYVGKLVETNKGEAYIRYGESRRLMSEEEEGNTDISARSVRPGPKGQLSDSNPKGQQWHHANKRQNRLVRMTCYGRC